jgi:predicted MFS family arabinose efflux permease
VPLALLVVATVLAHSAYNGCRLTISLYALQLGASPLTVGVLMSLFAALPMVLGVHAGRLVDRVGVRRPLLAAVAFIFVAVVTSGLLARLPVLFVTATIAGTSFMLFHICVQHAVGEMGGASARLSNFGWLALGFSISNFIGPMFAGVAIDAVGHASAFLLQSTFALASFGLLYMRRAQLSHTTHAPKETAPRNARELLASAELRRVFIVTGLLASAWDMFVFVTPIYGTSIGLSASTIGFILASFATATIIVRLALPWLSRRLREWSMITATLCIACVAYLLFPMVRTVALLAAISFLLGLGLGATQPSILALIYAKAPPGRAGEAVGVRSVVLATSSTLLPLGVGGLGAALGMGPVFWSMAAALALGGWFANRRRLETRPPRPQT